MRKAPLYGFLYWPMAALYALFYLGGEDALKGPHFISDWLGYTVMAAVTLLPPLMLGYLVGRAEHDISRSEAFHEPTEAERTHMLMKPTLSGWRRVAGTVCMVAGGLAFLPLLLVAIRYGKGSAWAVFWALVATFAVMGAGIWLGEWFWKPLRDAQARRRAPRAKVEVADALKKAEAVGRSYVHLIAEFGTRLPEEALPYSKPVIRDALVLWGLATSDQAEQGRLCVLYGDLEEFLPHADWKILHEWDRLLKTQDVDATLQSPHVVHEAVRLQTAASERAKERMAEFKARIHTVDPRGPTRK
jgi:hypothetical protein